MGESQNKSPYIRDPYSYPASSHHLRPPNNGFCTFWYKSVLLKQEHADGISPPDFKLQGFGSAALHQNGLYIGLWKQEVSFKDPQPLSREDYHCLLTAGLDQEALAEALVQSLGPKSCTLGPKPDPPSSAVPWAVLEGSSFCNIASRVAGQHELGLEEKKLHVERCCLLRLRQYFTKRRGFRSGLSPGFRP